MLWHMLKGALIRQKRRMIMIALTIALGVSLTTAMLNVMLDVGDKVNQELKAYGANIMVTPGTASLISELYEIEDNDTLTDTSGQYLEELDLGNIKTIFWSNNIVAFAPYLRAQAAIGNNGTSAIMVGTWFNNNLKLPTGESVETGIKQLKTWWEVKGEWAQDNVEREIMVGSKLASKLGIKPGDEVKVNLARGNQNEVLIVKGIFSSGGPEDEQIFASLNFVQQALNLDGKVGQLEVSALTTPENELARKAAQNPAILSTREWEIWYCTAYVSAIAYQIEEAIPNSSAKPIQQVAESEGIILNKIQLLMLLITILSLIASAMGISNLVTASVMERSREIGLLKAIGATDGAILTLTLTETMITGIIGGILGYFTGLGFAQIIGWTVFGSAVAVKVMIIPLVILLVVGVILVGSLPAIRMLLSLRPAEVLHGR